VILCHTGHLETIFVVVVVIYVNIQHTSVTLSKPFQLLFSFITGETKKRVFVVNVRKIIQPRSSPVTRGYKFVCQGKNNHLEHCSSCTRLISSLNIESLRS